MLKKILATVSVAGILAGAAGALEVTPAPSAPNYPGYGNFPLLLAAELNYGSTTGVTTTADRTLLEFEVSPTGGSFPTGNVLMRVEVTNATFSAALNGSEVVQTTGGTSVVSTGGTSGSSVVTFLLSDVSSCGQIIAPAITPETCSVQLPLRLTGAGDVSVAVGLQTDAGAPIDNSSLTNLVSANLVRIVPAFTIDIDADTAPTIALLDPDAPFTDLSVVGGNDRILGDITAEATRADVDPTAAGVATRVVSKDLTGVTVGTSDVASMVVTVAGNMASFAASTAPTATAAGVSINGGAATVSATAGTATRSIPAVELFLVDALVAVDENSVTTIARSDYSATVVITPTAASGLTAGASATGALQSITREGTEVVFPWTQSATQGTASGVSSVFRIGNLSGQDTGAVYAEVRNTSEAGFSSSGIVQLASSIDADGEFVINSADLEAAVGNYGRGDVSFIIEADDSNVTGRQFVVRNGNVQQVIGGTVEQDQN